MHSYPALLIYRHWWLSIRSIVWSLELFVHHVTNLIYQVRIWNTAGVFKNDDCTEARVGLRGSRWEWIINLLPNIGLVCVGSPNYGRVQSRLASAVKATMGQIHWTNITNHQIPIEDSSLPPSLWTITLSEISTSTLATDNIHNRALYKLSFEFEFEIRIGDPSPSLKKGSVE